MSDALRAVLEGLATPAIAVSGGVDSMTLMAFAVRETGADPRAFHAISPAVPPRATARVKALASAQNWALEVVGAGEFADPDYLKNPVNRCYFCKSNLYARLAAETNDPICSGANLDDLSDFRPGLEAAAERGVRHPFIEAKMGKAEIRALAARLGLHDLADLPAQPCLSSRVETGLPIDAAALAVIDRIERLTADALGPGDIRCRLTHQGMRIEAPAAMMPSLEVGPLRHRLAQEIMAAGFDFAGVAPYRRGAAFLHPV